MKEKKRCTISVIKLYITWRPFLNYSLGWHSREKIWINEEAIKKVEEIFQIKAEFIDEENKKEEEIKKKKKIKI